MLKTIISIVSTLGVEFLWLLSKIIIFKKLFCLIGIHSISRYDGVGCFWCKHGWDILEEHWNEVEVKKFIIIDTPEGQYTLLDFLG